MDLTTEDNSRLHLNDIQQIENEEQSSTNATKDFLYIFEPIHYASAIFFAQKYGTKNGSLVPHSYFKNLGCISINILIIILFHVTFQEFSAIFNKKIVYIMYFIIYLQYIIQYVLLLFSLFYLRIYNYELIVKLRDIYSFLHDKKDVFKNRMILLIPCIVCCFGTSFIVVLKLYYDAFWSWYRALFIFSTLIFDLEMIYASYVLYFLAYNMSQWNAKLNTENCDENVMKEIMETLIMVVDAISLAKKVSQLMILYYFATSFTQTLCYLEILILWVKDHTVATEILTSHTLGVVIWITKGLFAQAAVCFCSEVLYRRIEQAKCLAATKLITSTSDANRRIGKNILRVCNTSFSKISACGLFTIDGRLPLRVAGAVTSYTIVLLQFAFL